MPPHQRQSRLHRRRVQHHSTSHTLSHLPPANTRHNYPDTCSSPPHLPDRSSLPPHTPPSGPPSPSTQQTMPASGPPSPGCEALHLAGLPPPQHWCGELDTMPGPDQDGTSCAASGLRTLSIVTAADALCGRIVDLASERARAQLITLAHQIGKPRQYVGVSAFL